MMPSVDREDRGRLPLASLLLTLFLVAEVLGLAWFQSPGERFTRYIGNDSGVDLSMQDMMARGFRPTVDFACAYGLLPILANRAWYGMAGLTPGAYRLEVVLGTCLVAWGMARVAMTRRVGWPGIALITLSIPDVLFPTNFTIVHVLEPALLVHALAEQARGRRSSALALATAACFVKPSMGYVYGACLLICIAAASRGATWKARGRAILPAAIVGVGLGLILAGFFGVDAVLGTLVPSKGAEIYRLAGFGFFRGIGRLFWVLPDAGVRDYFRYEVGLWLIGSVGLAVGGLVALFRMAPGGLDPERARDAEIIACCATLHVIFVTCFFAHRTSWTYYFPVLILGLALLGKGGRSRTAFAWMLAAMLLVNDRSKLQATWMERQAATPAAETLGLWSTPTERAEWARVLELCRGHRPVLLGLVEGSVPLAPKFAGPIAAYFCPGLTLPIEIRRKADQIASADRIVVMVEPDWVGFRFWPELAGALDGCHLAFEGKTFRLYQRTRPPGPFNSPEGRP